MGGPVDKVSRGMHRLAKETRSQMAVVVFRPAPDGSLNVAVESTGGLSSSALEIAAHALLTYIVEAIGEDADCGECPNCQAVAKRTAGAAALLEEAGFHKTPTTSAGGVH